MRLNYLAFCFLILFACSNSKKEIQTEQSQIETISTDSGVNNKLTLDSKLKGEWINTALFDSTLAQKKLAPWLSSFYGEILLKINESDSVDIEGNMDSGKAKISIENPTKFKLSELSTEPTFTYLEKQDLLLRTSPYDTFLFRRKLSSDIITFMDDEEKFNDFFLKKLFEGNYLEITKSDTTKLTIKNKTFFGEPKKTKIERLWSGFETFTPFDFDAIQLKEIGKKEPEYFGWEFSGDTLKLYSTTHKFDEESGFAEYKRGLVYRKFIKLK
jgi:hypothetical protein